MASGTADAAYIRRTTRPDVIVLSTLDWDAPWQAPHELAARAALTGHVAFVENTGVRAPRLADWQRVRHRLARSTLGTPRPDDVSVISPLVAPPFRRGVAGTLNRDVALPALANRIRRTVSGPATLVTFHPTDTALELIDRLDDVVDRVVYFCTAAFEHLTDRPAALLEAERALVRRADLTIAQIPAVEPRLRALSDRVVPIVPGVNMALFQLASGPRSGPTRIGYVGGLHEYLDIELLAELARRRPDWEWVFVGPATVDLTPLRAMTNVQLLGQRDHAEVADLVGTFDVCTVPYRVDSYTVTLVPTKINEYLAVGRPVVATPLPYVVDLRDRHDAIVAAAPTPDAFLAAIERALAGPDTDADRRRRRAVVEDASWERLMSLVASG